MFTEELKNLLEKNNFTQDYSEDPSIQLNEYYSYGVKDKKFKVVFLNCSFTHKNSSGKYKVSLESLKEGLTKDDISSDKSIYEFSGDELFDVQMDFRFHGYSDNKEEFGKLNDTLSLLEGLKSLLKTTKIKEIHRNRFIMGKLF